jgi:hypothetical protein
MPDFAYLLRAALGIPDYWHPRLEIQRECLAGVVGRYPLTMDGKADYPGELDAEGVPVLYWGPGRTARPSPINIVLYGLGSHDAWLSQGSARYREQFEKVLSWLERHAEPLGEGIGWAYDVDLPHHGLTAPWHSGIVQGFALSLFVRAYLREPSVRTLNLALNTWRGFRHPISNGGFARPVRGGMIYEEYPGPELDCVFNGQCFALIGLWEAWRSGLIPQAEGDFRAGVAAVAERLSLFDCNRWSLYSLNRRLGRPFLASPYYHRANALLGTVLGLITGQAEFEQYGARWLATSRSLGRRVGVSVRIGWDRYRYSPDVFQRDKSKK